MDELYDEYKAWCEEQNLPHVCVEEQQTSMSLTRDQRIWLMDFEARWDRQQAIVDRLDRIKTDLNMAIAL
jgi:hypothetical protein